MKVISLRAPGAPAPVELHPGLTVVHRPLPQDRLDLRSAFRSIVGLESSRLEVVVEINGVVMAVAPGLPATLGLVGVPDPVVQVPGAMAATATGTAPGLAGVSSQSASRLEEVRHHERALVGEFNLVVREIQAERAQQSTAAGARSAAVEVSSPRRRSHLAELVREARTHMSAMARQDPDSLADRLEELDRRRRASRSRQLALGQLAEECRVALNATEDAIDRIDGLVTDPERDARLRAVRGEIAAIGDGGVVSRRDRRHLDHLRATEARIVAEMQRPDGSHALPGPEARAGLEARAELLRELADHWLALLVEIEQDRQEEAQLLGRASHLLGDHEPAATTRNARLVAARLRQMATSGTHQTEDRDAVATELAGALGVAPAPLGELVTLAEEELASPDHVDLRSEVPAVGDPLVVPDPTAATPLPVQGRVTGATESSQTRLARLTVRERELRERIQLLAEERRALERAVVLTDRGSPEDPGSSGPVVGVAAGGAETASDGSGWSLTDHLAQRQSVSVVGSLPTLVEESSDGVPPAVRALDPMALLALASSVQIVWVTEREELAAAVEAMGSAAHVIRC